MVSHLVDQGANVNNKNSGGITALHMAAVRGHLETVKYLVEKGANVNTAEIMMVRLLYTGLLKMAI